jgi:hypothetical protein
MRPLSEREKRTVWFGVIGLSVYLLLFCGLQLWKALSRHRAEYLQLLSEAQTLKTKMQLYEDRTATIRKLMEGFQMDPAKLSRTTVVAQASAAVQNAARTGGVQIGVVREMPGRTSNKELAAIQLEAMGPVPGLLRFLHQMESVGYPLVIESCQIGSDPAKPGPLKMSLVIMILDFDQWKKKEAPNAST